MSKEKVELESTEEVTKNTIVEDAKGAVQEFFDEKGEETRQNLLKGGSPVIVNLTNKTEVEFVSDYGFFKKGQRQEVSDVALAIYQKKGVVKKL